MTQEYSIDSVYRAFSVVRQRSDQSIGLPEFVEAFRELAKFFNHLNVVFSFVANDLADKFTLLDSLYRNDSIHYRTVQSMIDYEKNREDKTGLVALLRLLRALEFTYLFLQRALLSSNSNVSTKQVAWDVYKQTLHRRHNRAVRASIWVATTTVPKRESLKQTLLRGEVEPNTPEKCFPLIEEIYKEIHRLYERNQFLELVEL